MGNEPQRAAVGIALVLFSTVAMGIVPVAAKFAFIAGSNVLTVVTVRGFIGAAVMAGLILALGRSFSMGRTALLLSLLSGVFYTAMSYGFIGSVDYIPVSLVVLIFFTHPVIIAFYGHLRGESRLTAAKVALISAVLIGLAIVLGPDLSSLDPVGIALAFLASVSVSGMVIINARAQKQASSMGVTFYMTAVTVIVYSAVTTAAGAWQLPATPIGWVGLAGTGLGLGVGLLAYFAAFNFIGPLRTTMISTVEPLVGVLFAVALLGETLEPWQWAGAILVVAALVLFERPERSGRKGRSKQSI